MTKEKYAERVKNHLCIRCGKPTVCGVRCPKCAEKQRQASLKYRRSGKSREQKNAKQRIYHRQYYAFMKSLGMCRCGKPVAIGFAMCPDCIEKDRQRQERMRSENREGYNAYMRDYNKTLRARRIANSLCTRCGKPKGNSPYLECVECRNKRMKQRKKDGEIPRSEWTSYGLCYHCGKPAMEPYKVCKECYDRDMRHLDKANASPLTQKARKEYSERFYRRMVVAKLEKEHRTGVMR